MGVVCQSISVVSGWKVEGELVVEVDNQIAYGPYPLISIIGSGIAYGIYPLLILCLTTLENLYLRSGSLLGVSTCNPLLGKHIAPLIGSPSEQTNLSSIAALVNSWVKLIFSKTKRVQTGGH